MATVLGDVSHAKVVGEVYEMLRTGGLLRGSHLNDVVEIDGAAFRANTADVGLNLTRSAKLVVALQSLGTFERLHVYCDRSTDKVRVCRDSEECKLDRMAGAISDNADDELYKEVKSAGGPMAVARKILEMGRAR
jgi:hypothetical protein